MNASIQWAVNKPGRGRNSHVPLFSSEGDTTPGHDREVIWG